MGSPCKWCDVIPGGNPKSRKMGSISYTRGADDETHMMAGIRTRLNHFLPEGPLGDRAPHYYNKRECGTLGTSKSDK